MPNLNKVMLMGRLTRDPELRYLPSGAAVAQFGLATNRKFKNASGELQEETTFVDIEMFGRRAEVLKEYLHKGDPLFVEGRLKFDQWEAKDGSGKRSKLKVICENFEFMGGRREGSEGGGAPQPAQEAKGDEPFDADSDITI